MIRVASVPADHPYIRRLGPVAGEDGVVRLADRRLPGQRGWWPPRMLEPSWVEANSERFDLFHVHFGFDGRHPDQLRELCALLRDRGKPLVLTVHDLRNPNHESHRLHHRQLAELIPPARRLITLTVGAREALLRSFGREATVIAHPHIVPPAELGRGRSRPDETVRVGVHLKSLRSNMTGVPLLEALAPLAGDPGLSLRVDIHEEVWHPQAPGFRADLRCAAEHFDAAGLIDLRVHPYFTDEELYEYLAEIEVAVLPYRFGTHSGWLETCRDLGTAVVAPTCGFYAEQGRTFPFESDEAGLDAFGLRSAVRAAAAAVEAGRIRPLGPAFRRRQREQIARAHRLVYEGALASAPRPAARASRKRAARSAPSPSVRLAAGEVRGEPVKSQIAPQ